jgi:2-dehydropantoate 2-reductase
MSAEAGSKIAIFGAGSVGCYLGGRLAAAGADVIFIGRPRFAEELAKTGLTLTSLHGTEHYVPAEKVQFFTDAAALADVDLVLVTVKSADSDLAGLTLVRHLKPTAIVLSFQNGLHNTDILQNTLPNHRVLAGMIPYNVVNRGNGRFHQGSDGVLEVADDAVLRPFLSAFERSGLALRTHHAMQQVLWSKLLLNLNNSINALSGQPLKQELSQWGFRRCLALAQQEALDLYRRAGIKPVRLTPIPPKLMPKLLSVPDAIFKRLAKRMLAMDPLARSSMWEDLEAGRQTEVDWINGEVLRLAESLGRAAPINARLVALVRSAESGGRRDWEAMELLADLERQG